MKSTNCGASSNCGASLAFHCVHLCTVIVLLLFQHWILGLGTRADNLSPYLKVFGPNSGKLPGTILECRSYCKAPDSADATTKRVSLREEVNTFCILDGGQINYLVTRKANFGSR